MMLITSGTVPSATIQAIALMPATTTARAAMGMRVNQLIVERS